MELLELVMLAWVSLGLAYVGYRVTRLEGRVETLTAPDGQLIYDVDRRAWVCNDCDPLLFREVLGFTQDAESNDAQRRREEEGA